jgi:signal peptidase I
MRRSRKKTSNECAAGERDSPESLVEEDEEKVKKQSEKQRQKKVIKSTFVKLGTMCLTIWVIFTFIFGITQVKGETMYPSIRDGDLMLYYRLENDFYVGDVVTFLVNGYRRTARIVAMGGDVVDIDEAGQLLVNGDVQSEEIFYPTDKITSEVVYPYTVEENSYFVLCDFRTASVDSRGYGAISEKDLDGKVITILRRRGL